MISDERNQSADAASPIPPRPHWSVWAVALAGMSSATLGAVLTVGLFEPDSVGAKLVAIGIVFLGTVSPAVAYIMGQQRNAGLSIKGAENVRVAEAKRDTAIAQAQTDPRGIQLP